MTNSENDRLDRIEGFVESNAREIQAMAAQTVEARLEAAEERQEIAYPSGSAVLDGINYN